MAKGAIRTITTEGYKMRSLLMTVLLTVACGFVGMTSVNAEEPIIYNGDCDDVKIMCVDMDEDYIDVDTEILVASLDQNIGIEMLDVVVDKTIRAEQIALISTDWNSPIDTPILVLEDAPADFGATLGYAELVSFEHIAPLWCDLELGCDGQGNFSF